MSKKKVLYLVDLQRDFFEGGSLEVPNSNEIIPYIIQTIEKGEWDIITGSVDSHPENHISFASRFNIKPFTEFEGELKFPDHCVVETTGAEVLPEFVDVLLGRDRQFQGFYCKGGARDVEEFSVCSDGLEDASYKKLGVSPSETLVCLVGLATDYCVKETAKSFRELGCAVVVDLKGCRAFSETGTEETIDFLEKLGVCMLNKK